MRWGVLGKSPPLDAEVKGSNPTEDVFVFIFIFLLLPPFLFSVQTSFYLVV